MSVRETERRKQVGDKKEEARKGILTEVSRQNKKNEKIQAHRWLQKYPKKRWRGRE